MKRKIIQKLTLLITILIWTWSLMQIFELNQVILPRLGLWRYLIVIGIVLVWICLSSVIANLFYYRIYPNRSQLERNLPKLIQKASNRIWTVSIAGRSFITLDGFERHVDEALKRGVQFRILLCDPSTEFIKEREMLEDEAATGRIRVRIRGTLSYWHELRSKLGRNLLSKLQIRIHDKSMFTYSMWIIDDTVFFIPYLYRILGGKSIVLQVNKNKRSKRLIEKLENNYECLWADSKEITTERFHKQLDDKQPAYISQLDPLDNINSISYLVPLTDKQIMLIRRRKDSRKGYYSFLGGHALKGESNIHALEREVMEEAGVTFRIINSKLIRIIGPDNTNIPDDYFENVSVISPHVREYTIEEIPVMSSEIEATDITGKTTYHFFQGEILGTPKLSDEVDDFKWWSLSEWINKARTHEIHIQPIDLLYLRYLQQTLTNDKSSV